MNYGSSNLAYTAPTAPPATPPTPPLAIPANEIVFGTGLGVTSDNRLSYSNNNLVVGYVGSQGDWMLQVAGNAYVNGNHTVAGSLIAAGHYAAIVMTSSIAAYIAWSPNNLNTWLIAGSPLSG